MFGAVGLITGFLGRFCAFGIFCVMVGAIFTVHLHNGFFMNWEGTQKGEGSSTTCWRSAWRSP